MLRLARLKRIVMRHSDGAGLGNFQLWESVGLTLFTIIFLAHMLACFYYMVGGSNQTLENGVCLSVSLSLSLCLSLSLSL